ncbi:RIP metalloprotease RseP [Lachnospiraceae bacterium LCP25S3_G4]
MGIILALLLFSFIVIVHELGHFLLAKKNGINVSEFSLGMGPRIISKQIGETRYSWKLLPLGGSCMMGEDEVDDMSEGSFNSKSVWARMSVIAAGPIFNFILAFILSTILVFWVGYDAPVVDKLTPGFPAQEAGIQPGDTIVKMNQKPINIWREVAIYNQFHQGQSIDVTYERDGKQYTATVVPAKDETGRYIMGVFGSGNTKAGFFKSLQYGVYEVKYWICTTMEGLKQLVTGAVGIEQMSGPVGIVNFVGDTYEQSAPNGWEVVVGNLMNIAILLTANLGVMNLLPIPALDGGRLVFLVIEAIRRKRIPPEKEGMVHFAGFVLLMLLMVVIMFNDIRNLII